MAKNDPFIENQFFCTALQRGHFFKPARTARRCRPKTAGLCIFAQKPEPQQATSVCRCRKCSNFREFVAFFFRMVERGKMTMRPIETVCGARRTMRIHAYLRGSRRERSERRETRCWERPMQNCSKSQGLCRKNMPRRDFCIRAHSQ